MTNRKRLSTRKKQEQERRMRVYAAIVIVLVIVFLIVNNLGKGIAPVDTSGMPDFDPSDLIATDSGLQYQDFEVGTGDEASAGQSVVVHYSGWLTDGTKFDSSKDRDDPFDFTLGQGAVIRGWDEGVAGMKVGGTRLLVIPPELGYGSADRGTIPPNSTLVFVVELLEIR